VTHRPSLKTSARPRHAKDDTPPPHRLARSKSTAKQEDALATCGRIPEIFSHCESLCDNLLDELSDSGWGGGGGWS
jgi:hypothetical protein